MDKIHKLKGIQQPTVNCVAICLVAYLHSFQLENMNIEVLVHTTRYLWIVKSGIFHQGTIVIDSDT